MIMLASPAYALELLKVHPDNPIYFQAGDNSQALYLSGAYAARSLQDLEGYPFPFAAHLKTLVDNDMNLTTLVSRVGGSSAGFFLDPTIYRRSSGSGTALDGGAKFDLTQLNDAYFERLKQRVSDLNDNGVYVIYTLFNSFDGERKQYREYILFEKNPFNINNNINNIDVDTNANDIGEELYRLPLPTHIKAIQEAYIKRVVDTLNPFNNVLYEVCNECLIDSKDWQIWVSESIKNYQGPKTKQHLVGISGIFYGISNIELAQSPATDWWQPGAFKPQPRSLWDRLITLDWRQAKPDSQSAAFELFTSPPSASGEFGNKPIIFNSDHFRPSAVTVDWVWKSISRGLHPLSYETRNLKKTGAKAHTAGLFLNGERDSENVHATIKSTRYFASKMHLQTMFPVRSLSSTEYALADSGEEYLIYQPDNGPFTVHGLLAKNTYQLEWFNVSLNRTVASSTIPATGASMNFTPPFSNGPAILYLKRSSISKQR
ncbi:MAG: hypothetical protein COC05_05740 [Gammaproteobacteria bacterium]|nr:MAG: hypothetical protein COC05_05740 [Gammaproteobacteria bacterium]